ncbi:hypothetical protein CI109_101844 [Kwoniella shandongensis]|uniref:Uncharacterized protein n=1 Tax=Kwoniella shandongensis TaxID=1734106 RepID=A0A5M6BSP5_9TREE|nr:uncharacterized protein CI109_007021 [Kwoniella shandongensis]KAA5524635.1 hypothetical protein CI109_007021 [Kwoniella shandongensis]
MSAPAPAPIPVPEASGTRQRTNKLEKTEADLIDDDKNPASLSANPNKRVARNKPYVKPPFVDMSMNKFLTYLVASLFLILAFYMWRFTVWAAQVGGYWALITGNHKTPASMAASSAAALAATAASAASVSSVSSSSAAGATGSTKAADPKSIKPKPATTPEDTIESQIYHLANSLGIKPAELSGAIRPLIDPSIPDPAEAAKKEAEALKKEMEAKMEEQKAETGGSVLGILGEALLD